MATLASPLNGVPTPEQIHDGDDHILNPKQETNADEKVLTPPNSDSHVEDQEDEDIGDIEPAEYWGGGKIPIFRPNMRQFRDFQKFIDKIDKYGMKSGIVKVVPPQEWLDNRPDLSEAVKSIRIKNPIRQEFAGTHGTYTQANIEKQRSYNLPQWKITCGESNHQPPAPRGERRRTIHPPKSKPESKPQPSSTVSADGVTNSTKKYRGRPRKSQKGSVNDSKIIPSSPTSPVIKMEGDAIETTENAEDDEFAQITHVPGNDPPKESKRSTPSRRGRGRGRPARGGSRNNTPRAKKEKPDTVTSVSSRRMNNKTEQAIIVDETAFQNFDYHLDDLDQFTPERCRELEDNYWKTINYGTPMYGADMPGSLFKDLDMSWNVSKLPNLLDVLGTNVPGVNTAYLYLGMWKATFAWHLEDVDLYSINYIHFGAPKQWYSISQEDARRFEAAMKSIWPNDAKHCDQFLRHKTYLISPEKLKSQFNITVNKLVHYEGEFVITYPYGYHSGFNIGYNCAESVNFANEAWLNYGRIARKCNCESDSVWVDVYEIERKLRGEPTPEYLEVTDDEYDFDREGSPPPASANKVARKRKRQDPKTSGRPIRQPKRVRIRVRAPTREPCILCPNDPKFDVLIPTDNAKMAHRLCALYTPETYVVADQGKEMVFNVSGIKKGRWELKCNFCRSKKGTVFQCSSKKCARAYHATCAVAAGVQIDIGTVPTWGEDGTEYYCEGYDFRCRFHRPKRPKNADSESLEKNSLVMNYGKTLKAGDVIQAMYLDGDMFGAMVIENRPGESSCLVEVLPDGDTIELEWKYILLLDPDESQRPKPSPDAKPLPEHLLKTELSIANRKDGVPEVGDPFHDPIAGQKWAEFKTASTAECKNSEQFQVDIFKNEGLWHYLGNTSTEAKAQYTHDPKIRTHNLKSVFLDTVKPPPIPLNQYPRLSNGSHTPSKVSIATDLANRSEKPYVYKPRTTSSLSLQQQQYQQQLIQKYGSCPMPLTNTNSESHPRQLPQLITKNLSNLPQNKNSTAYAVDSTFNSAYMALTNAAAQELLKNSMPPSISAASRSPQSHNQRFDNSPRQPDWYNQVHSRYSAQAPAEYQKRYQTLAQATHPTHSNLQANLGLDSPLAISHSLKPKVENGTTAASIPNPVPQSPATMNSLPFTPPSQRPSVIALASGPTTTTTAAASTSISAPPTHLPSLSANSVAAQPPSKGISAQISSTNSSTKPSAVHQTAEQFRQQVSKDGAENGDSRFENLMRQLGAIGYKERDVHAVEKPIYSPISEFED